jgi:hypothetical protein
VLRRLTMGRQEPLASARMVAASALSVVTGHAVTGRVRGLVAGAESAFYSSQEVTGTAEITRNSTDIPSPQRVPS